LVLLPLSWTFVQASASRTDIHVYLFRGFANVFSLGMDSLASDLQRRGIPASVHSHLAWSSLADEAAREYKLGHTRTIIAVGHSMGADAVASFVQRLGDLGISVALAVALDDGRSLTLNSGRVGKFVNLYLSGGVLGGGVYTKGPRFSGSLVNINLAKQRPDIGHLNIDKSAAIHRMIIGYVGEAVGKGSPNRASSSGKLEPNGVASPAVSGTPAAAPLTVQAN
jgi:hypothetical protein